MVNAKSADPAKPSGGRHFPFTLRVIALYAFARLDHILCGFRIFLEVCRLQMRLERVRTGVDLKKSDAAWIFLFRDKIEGQTSRLDTNSGLPVLLGRGFEVFQLREVDLQFCDKDELSLYLLRSRSAAR